MTDDDRLRDITEQLHSEFQWLSDTLRSEGGADRFTGILRIERLLRKAIKKSDNAKAAIKRSIEIWVLLNSGYGSFSDYHIWRDNFEERRRHNNRLQECRNNISSLFADFEALVDKDT